MLLVSGDLICGPATIGAALVRVKLVWDSALQGFSRAELSTPDAGSFMNLLYTKLLWGCLRFYTYGDVSSERVIINQSSNIAGTTQSATGPRRELTKTGGPLSPISTPTKCAHVHYIGRITVLARPRLDYAPILPVVDSLCGIQSNGYDYCAACPSDVTEAAPSPPCRCSRVALVAAQLSGLCTVLHQGHFQFEPGRKQNLLKSYATGPQKGVGQSTRCCPAGWHAEEHQNGSQWLAGKPPALVTRQLVTFQLRSASGRSPVTVKTAGNRSLVRSAPREAPSPQRSPIVCPQTPR